MTDARQAEPREAGTNSPDKRKEYIPPAPLDAFNAYYDYPTEGRADIVRSHIERALSRIETLEDEVRWLRLAATPGDAERSVGYVLDEIAHLRKTADDVENAGLTQKKFGSDEWIPYVPSSVRHLREKADDLEGMLSGRGYGGTKAPSRHAEPGASATASTVTTPRSKYEPYR